jgi:hypothetical protein
MLQKQVETNMQEIVNVEAAVTKARNSKVNIALRQEAENLYATSLNTEESQAVLTNVMLPATRAMNKRTKGTGNSVSNSTADDSSLEGIPFGDRRPIITNGTLKWKRIPREPIPRISDFKLWVGKQLMHKNMPTKYQHMHLVGELIAMDSTYPEGLLAVPNAEGHLRIIVPPSEIKALTLQTHEDIHHQNHFKVLHVLKASYYWPNMAKGIEQWCTACPTCPLQLLEGNTLKRSSI